MFPAASSAVNVTNVGPIGKSTGGESGAAASTPSRSSVALAPSSHAITASSALESPTWSHATNSSISSGATTTGFTVSFFHSDTDTTALPPFESTVSEPLCGPLVSAARDTVTTNESCSPAASTPDCFTPRLIHGLPPLTCHSSGCVPPFDTCMPNCSCSEPKSSEVAAITSSGEPTGGATETSIEASALSQPAALQTSSAIVFVPAVS